MALNMDSDIDQDEELMELEDIIEGNAEVHNGELMQLELQEDQDHTTVHR